MSDKIYHRDEQNGENKELKNWRMIELNRKLGGWSDVQR